MPIASERVEEVLPERHVLFGALGQPFRKLVAPYRAERHAKPHDPDGVCGVRRGRDGGASRERRTRDARNGRDCGPYRLLEESDQLALQLAFH